MNLLQINTDVVNAEGVLNTGWVWLTKIVDMAAGYAPKRLGAILVYIIGQWLVNKIAAVLRKVLTKKDFDISLQKFLISSSLQDS